jgi:hypothetical protein
MPDNGRRRSKAIQKNVSVYLGARDGWQHQVLQAVCRQFNLTESEFFRELFLQRLTKWQLYDPISESPDEPAIERFKRRRAVVSLPESLESHEEDSDGPQEVATSSRRRAKTAL